MATDVLMPQMGESIAEGTITKWLKKVGDPVERDEPLYEISTDKVDAEIPSPESGILTEIVVGEGETVEVKTIVARIGAAGDSAAPAADEAAATGPAPAQEAPAPAAAARRRRPRRRPQRRLRRPRLLRPLRRRLLPRLARCLRPPRRTPVRGRSASPPRVRRSSAASLPSTGSTSRRSRVPASRAA